MDMRILFGLLFVLLLSGCSLIVTGPETYEQSQRDALLPQFAPLEGPLRIYWNEHRIPFIEAESEADLAVGIGIVHAHLRGAQLELFRRVVRGRLAESFGPLAADIDHTLRIMELGRASAAILADMDPETRDYLESYVKGLNHTLRIQKERGLKWPVLEALDIEPQYWSQEDVVAVWRLFSADVNWFRFYQALSVEGQDPEQSWRELRRRSSSVSTFRNLPQKQRVLAGIFLTLSRSGSNSMVIDGRHSASGRPMIASDPHVGLALPSLWIIMGLKSPEVEAVGFTIPGLPILALGRSRHIAWGGTNMWGLSSALIRLGPEDLEEASERIENVSIAYWPDREIAVRNTIYGPVLSDSPIFDDVRGEGYEFAFSWAGHQPSDELTTYRKILKARNCEEFRQAFRSWAVSAQNYLCADYDGNIEHILAYARPYPGPISESLFRSTEQKWSGFESPLKLPFRRNPESGILASANDEPEWSDVAVGLFFSPAVRKERMEKLAQNGPLSAQDLMALQKDACSALAQEGRQKLLDAFEQARLYHKEGSGPILSLEISGEDAAIFQDLKSWDGCYRNGSRGPLVYETIYASLREQMDMEPANGEMWMEVLEGMNGIRKNSEARFRQMLQSALEEARGLEQDAKWNLKTPVAHLLGSVPLIGGAWVLDRIAEDGANHTIYKRGFVFEDGETRVSYGANARHISDLADPDENYFVLFGGQDGIMQSPTTTDQVELWKQGSMIRVPLNTYRLDSWKLTIIEPHGARASTENGG